MIGITPYLPESPAEEKLLLDERGKPKPAYDAFREFARAQA